MNYQEKSVFDICLLACKRRVVMKKLIVTIVLLSLILAMPIPSLAKAEMDAVDEHGILLEEKAEDLALDEAGTLALLFIAQNLDISDTWSMETCIKDIRALYGLDDEISGYCFELETGNLDSGYVIVSVDVTESLIQEYSFKGKPVYYNKSIEIENLEKVIFIDPMNYFFKKDGKLLSIQDKDVEVDKDKVIKYKEEKEKNKEKLETKSMNKYLKELLKKHGTISFAGYDGQLTSGSYVITDVYDYLMDKFGVYDHVDTEYVSGVVGFDMDDYGSTNDCSLVAISTIAKYYSTLSSYPNIPNSMSDIYDDVLYYGEQHLYTPALGTLVSVIDNIASDCFDDWGYGGINGVNDYNYSFDNECMTEIDNDRPFVLSCLGGTYSNHSITVYGYQIYDGGYKDVEFFRVYDGWVLNTRYVDYELFSASGGTMTKIQ